MITQFEQGREDRAAYGEHLLDRLSARLATNGRRGLSARNLRNFRQVCSSKDVNAHLNPLGTTDKEALHNAEGELARALRKAGHEVDCDQG